MPKFYQQVLVGRIVKKTVGGKVIEGEVSQTQTSHLSVLLLIVPPHYNSECYCSVAFKHKFVPPI